MSDDEWKSFADKLAYSLDCLSQELKRYKINGVKNTLNKQWLMIEIITRISFCCIDQMQEKDECLHFLKQNESGIKGMREYVERRFD